MSDFDGCCSSAFEDPMIEAPAEEWMAAPEPVADMGSDGFSATSSAYGGGVDETFSNDAEPQPAPAPAPPSTAVSPVPDGVEVVALGGYDLDPGITIVAPEATPAVGTGMEEFSIGSGDFDTSLIGQPTAASVLLEHLESLPPVSATPPVSLPADPDNPWTQPDPAPDARELNEQYHERQRVLQEQLERDRLAREQYRQDSGWPY